MYKQFDKALVEKKNSEQMIRLYMDFCEDMVKSEGNFANKKLLYYAKSSH